MWEVGSSLSPNSPAYTAWVIYLFTERVFLCLATGINNELVTMRLLKGRNALSPRAASGKGPIKVMMQMPMKHSCSRKLSSSFTF